MTRQSDRQRTIRRDCPTCRAVIEFVVPQSVVPQSVLSEEGVSGAGVSGAGDAPATGLCGACGREVSICPVPTVALPISPSAEIYRPPAVRVDEAVLRTPRLFRTQWVPLLVLSTLLHLLWYLSAGLPSLLMTWFDWPATAVQIVLFASAGAMGVAMTIVVTSVVVLGLLQGVLRVARYGEAQRFAATDLLPSRFDGRTVAGMSGLVVLFLAGLAVSMGLALVAMVIAMLAFPPEQASAWAVVVASAMVLLVALSLELILWPAAFLIADGRAGLLGSVHRSVELSWRHLRSSFQLIVICTIISTIGSLLFPVLPIIAAPLALLPLADGYIQMTGSRANQVPAAPVSSGRPQINLGL